MDKIIEGYLNNIKKNNVKVDSIVVERMRGGQRQDCEINKIDLHELRSCSKILIAFAYGIAMDERFVCKDGKPLTLKTKVYSTFAKISNPPKQVKEWTIRTLLTHSTGYEKMMFNESHVENLDKFHLLDVLFATPIKYKTDTHFTYSNVEPYLLSIFFQENFGANIADFINERILKPLGVKKYIWENFGEYCAAATASYFNYKDFHKFGQLLYNYGKFNGKQIVPKWWVEEMTKPQVACPDYFKNERLLQKSNAGYFTWITKSGVVFRDGSDGQYIICDHNQDLLITIMSTEEEMSKVTEALRGVVEF